MNFCARSAALGRYGKMDVQDFRWASPSLFQEIGVNLPARGAVRLRKIKA